jgi:hypothetical protein
LLLLLLLLMLLLLLLMLLLLLLGVLLLLLLLALLLLLLCRLLVALRGLLLLLLLLCVVRMHCSGGHPRIQLLPRQCLCSRGRLRGRSTVLLLRAWLRPVLVLLRWCCTSALLPMWVWMCTCRSRACPPSFPSPIGGGVGALLGRSLLSTSATSAAAAATTTNRRWSSRGTRYRP